MLSTTPESGNPAAGCKSSITRMKSGVRKNTVRTYLLTILDICEVA